MASSSLKTLVLRWPAAATVAAGPVAARPTSFARCCPRSSAAPFSSVPKAPSPADRFACLARASLRQQSTAAVSVTRCFARNNSNLAESAQKSPNATNNKTATALGSKPQTKPSPTGANVGVDQPTLDWDSFFKLRVRRRYFQLFFSLVGGVGGGAAGAVFLAQGYAEPLVQQVPLDPLFTLGLMTFACAGLGWLIGPSIGSEIFYVINRRFKLQMRQKESQFLSRVRKNRADPTNSNAANPVPDFYGEKIQSVKGYRQWLKDQRAFNKKKTQNFI